MERVGVDEATAMDLPIMRTDAKPRTRKYSLPSDFKHKILDVTLIYPKITCKHEYIQKAIIGDAFTCRECGLTGPKEAFPDAVEWKRCKKCGAVGDFFMEGLPEDICVPCWWGP